MSKTSAPTYIVLLLSLCFAVEALAQAPQVADTPPRYFNGLTIESPLTLDEQQWKKLEAIPTTVVSGIINSCFIIPSCGRDWKHELAAIAETILISSVP
jgi:hypothetical protein